MDKVTINGLFHSFCDGCGWLEVIYIDNGGWQFTKEGAKMVNDGYFTCKHYPLCERVAGIGRKKQ